MNNQEVIQFLEIKDNLLELVRFAKREITAGKSDVIEELERLSGKHFNEFDHQLNYGLNKLRLVESYFQMIIDIEHKRQRALRKEVTDEKILS